MPEDIPEDSETFKDFDPPVQFPEESEFPPHERKPDFGMLVGIIGILLAVLIPVLQMNGIVINWQWSILAYLAIIVGSVWTFLVHGAPHRGKIFRLIGTSIIIAMLGTLATFATHNQYHIQHSIFTSAGIAAPNFIVVFRNDSYPSDEIITNNSVFSLKENRAFSIGVENVGTIIPKDFFVDFIVPTALNQTNLIFGNDWTQEPANVEVKNGVLTKVVTGYHWKWLANLPIAISQTNEPHFYFTSPIEISTNFGFPVVQVEVGVNGTGATNINSSIFTLKF